MGNRFCVNKCGQNLPIYSGPSTSYSKIGTLMSREACGHDRNWGGDDVICKVKFLSSSGGLATGYIIDPPVSGLADCSLYPYGTAVIGGVTYKTFMCKRALTIYNLNGTSTGRTVAAGRRVAFSTGLSGDSHPEWKAVNYVETSAGVWERLNPNTGGYGFVDTGLSAGSGYAKIGMYGSW